MVVRGETDPGVAVRRVVAPSGFEVLALGKNIQFFDGVIAALPHEDWDLRSGDSKPVVRQNSVRL